MVLLGVNIDHVATVRQARRTYEPDPVWAAVEAQLGGADAITVHLREDRRHIQDHDVHRVKDACHVRFNLEMAATDPMVAIACELAPHEVTLVPEGRQEITTEGGLDVAAQLEHLKAIVSRLSDAQIITSAFIDPDPRQADAAAQAGFDACEIHTGPYAHAFHEAGDDPDHPAVLQEIDKITQTARRIVDSKMRFNAGHALNYANVHPIAVLPALCELHIGHAIVSRAVFVGLRQAVSQMKQLVKTTP